METLNTMKRYLFLLLSLLFFGIMHLHSQVVIGENIGSKQPHQAAALDLNDGHNRGLKLPNVSLNVDPTVFVLDGGTSLNQVQAAGMVVYNTNSAVPGGKGIYYWDGTKWWKASPYYDIHVNNSYIWVSPAHTSKNIQITSNAAWTIETQPDNATVSPTSGNAGTTNITVSKNYSTNTDYGPHTFDIKYTSNSEIAATITVDALYIYDDDFMIPNNLLTGNTASYVIDVEGASETYTVVGSSTWINASKDPVTGQLVLTADQSNNQDPRTGYVTLAHADDPDYQVTLVVEQDLYSDIPPFKYFVVWLTWAGGGTDVDIAVEFAYNFYESGPNMGQPLPFDNTNTYSGGTSGVGANKAMGYYFASDLHLNGGRRYQGQYPNYTAQGLADSLMFWGGDAMSSQGETVFFNAPQITPPSRKLDNHPDWPRNIRLDIYAGRAPNTTITTTIRTYDDGIMLKPQGDGTQNINSTNIHPNTPTTGPMSINAFNFYNVDDGITLTDIWNSTTPWNLINSPSWSDSGITQTTVTGTPTAGHYRDSPSNSGSYHIATIIYDRYRRTAMVTWGGQQLPSPASGYIEPPMMEKIHDPKETGEIK